MGTENGMSGVELIGATAGAVWRTLETRGQMSFTKLGKEIKAPRDVVMQAIGWLAREGKVEIEETGRGRFICLK
jgi:hypothetical protein